MVKTKTFKFRSIQDFILSEEQFNNEGGYQGCLRNLHLPLHDLIMVESGEMTDKEFEDLPEWGA